MAERHPMQPPRIGPPARRPIPGQRSGTGPLDDAPMIDQIFPNREQPRGPGGGPDERPAFQHRRRSRVQRIFGRKTSTTQSLPTIAERPVRRRRVLLGIGTGAVVAGGAGTAATMLSNAFGGSDGPGGRRPDTARDGLGAAGLADSPSEAARIAATATPTWPTLWAATPSCTCCAGRPSDRP